MLQNTSILVKFGKKKIVFDEEYYIIFLVLSNSAHVGLESNLKALYL